MNASGKSVVWKYELDGILSVLEFARGSIARIDFDPNGALCAWVLVNDPASSSTDTRRVCVRGTGDPLPEGEWLYLNTFFKEAYVFHAFVGWDR